MDFLNKSKIGGKYISKKRVGDKWEYVYKEKKPEKKYKPNSWEPHYSDSKNLSRYKEIYRTSNTLDLPFDYNYDPKKDVVYSLNNKAKENFKEIVGYWKKKGKENLLRESEKSMKNNVVNLIKKSYTKDEWNSFTDEQRKRIMIKSIEIINSKLEKGGPGSGKYDHKKRALELIEQIKKIKSDIPNAEKETKLDKLKQELKIVKYKIASNQ